MDYFSAGLVTSPREREDEDLRDRRDFDPEPEDQEQRPKSWWEEVDHG